MKQFNFFTVFKKKTIKPIGHVNEGFNDPKNESIENQTSQTIKPSNESNELDKKETPESNFVYKEGIKHYQQ